VTEGSKPGRWRLGGVLSNTAPYWLQKGISGVSICLKKNGIIINEFIGYRYYEVCGFAGQISWKTLNPE